MKIEHVKSRVNFGHKLVIDLGASNRRMGSIKVSMLTDRGVQIDSSNGVVCPEGFKKDDDFLKGIAARISEIENKNRSKTKALKGKDKNLSGVMIFAPGPTINNKAGILMNLRKANGKPLQDIDYNKISTILKSNANADIAKDIKLFATNDMIGAGSAIARSLKNRGVLKNGYRAAFLMAGGGLGTGDIEVIKDTVIIKSSEGGHSRVLGTGKSIKTLEEVGASSTALIRNFGQALGLNENKIKKLIKLANARVATQKSITSQDIAEIKTLEKTKLFKKEVIDGVSHFTLKGIDEKARENACKKAVDKFVGALARISANKTLEGVNEIILTGPLTTGIGKTIETNPELFKSKTLITMLRDKTNSFMDFAGTTMAELYNLKFVDDIPVINNTQGGFTALKGKFSGLGRGNWLEIPLSVLKNVKK